MNNTSNNQSVFLGDQHSKAFWEHNYDALRAFKPDYLLLEVIGKHRYLNQKQRNIAKSTDVYMGNAKQMGYNSDAFELADDLDIPMIGIDIWTKPYVWPVAWGNPIRECSLGLSHLVREARMTRVANEFLSEGKVLLIVGAEHLRDESELFQLAKRKAIVKFYEL